ncbi:hypothetical protein [Cupriavidus sp. TMH.W2]|uniref:hypothetical protein n=1 Tax=Cupriavidus sp. TMH.W2 TaxID=3434465 RepID=UPI003D77FA8D
MTFRQRGATLLVGMIMLLLITLLAITSFKMAKGNLQAAGNAQQRDQAISAAQGAIEQTISSTQFTSTPANAIPNPCGNVANTSCVDVNGDGVTDVTVAVTSKCVSAQVIPAAALDFTKADDAGCLLGAGQDFGVEGGASNNSLCANTLWDVQAVATDTLGNAQATINQGAAVRVPATTVCP